MWRGKSKPAADALSLHPLTSDHPRTSRRVSSRSSSEMGPVATLINNAGKTDDVPTSALDYGSNVLDDHYEIMVRGTFLMSQAVARQMVA